MAAERIFALEAEQDIDEAYRWYERQRDGLGEDFLSSVEACLDAVCRMPTRFATFQENYRRALVRRFPYAVFFEYSEGKVIIYGIIHTSRNPDKWRERLP
jgi:plasmid stabilization system protein ParE